MSDITKCTGEGCPYKEDCYRFTAPHNDLRQSMFAVVPLEYVGEDVTCSKFWVNNEEDTYDRDKVSKIWGNT